MGQMATSSLGLFPLTPFKMVVGQDTLLLALLGAWICLAPASFLSFANRFSSFMKWPAALVVKSDTSLMLLKVRVQRDTTLMRPIKGESQGRGSVELLSR